MKTLITISLALATTIAFAQEPAKKDTAATGQQIEVTVEDGKLKAKVSDTYKDSTVADTTRIDLKNAYITIVSKSNVDDDDDDHGWSENDQRNSLTWWNGIDIGLNGMLGANRDFYMNAESEPLRPEIGRSRYISFNFAQYKFRIVKDYVGLTIGGTAQIYNFKYDGGTEFNFQGDSLFFSPSGDKSLNKNKLRATYLGIPLMLEFNTSLDPDKAFHVSAGVVGKVRIGNMYKQKYDLDGNSNKTSIKGDLGLNRWGLDAMARVGYRQLTFFAQMGLLPLFDNDNTPDVYSFSTGLFVKF